MSIQNLLKPSTENEEWSNLYCNSIKSNTVICDSIEIENNGDITTDNLIVNNNCTINGVNFNTLNPPSADKVLSTDGLGNTIWVDNTESGAVKYNGVLPTSVNQLAVFNNVDGTEIKKTNITDDGIELNLNGQNLNNVNNVSVSNLLKADTINEFTNGAGVGIEGVLFEDLSGINLNNKDILNVDNIDFQTLKCNIPNATNQDVLTIQESSINQMKFRYNTGNNSLSIRDASDVELTRIEQGGGGNGAFIIENCDLLAKKTLECSGFGQNATLRFSTSGIPDWYVINNSSGDGQLRFLGSSDKFMSFKPSGGGGILSLGTGSNDYNFPSTSLGVQSGSVLVFNSITRDLEFKHPAGFVLGMGGNLNTAPKLAESWGDANLATNNILSATNQMIVPINCKLCKITYSTNGDNTTQLEILKNGVSQLTFLQSASSGVQSSDISYLEGDKVALRATGVGTDPGSSNFVLYFCSP